MTRRAQGSAKAPRPVTVRVQVLAHGEGLPLPAYQTEQAAGLDLVAAVPERRPVSIGPGKRALIPTGLSIALPAGYEAQVRPRSGLALKFGVTCLNTPGTIDADYRGEVGVILANLGDAPFRVRRGDRIAQLVVAPVTHAVLKPVATLSRTSRGSGGFGSTRIASKKQPQPDVKPNKAKAKPKKSSAKPKSKRRGAPSRATGQRKTSLSPK